MSFKKITYSLIRYLPAMILILYGGAKVIGTQFGVSEWRSDLPMSEQSGYFLTWYYFSYSVVYTYILAAVQIGGAILLLFRRTTILGSIILLPVMGNIVIINIIYGIADGAMYIAIFISICLSIILLFHFKELKRFFGRDLTNFSSLGASPKSKRYLKISARSIVLIIPVSLLIFIHHNRVPVSPIDGVWDIEKWNEPNNIDKTPTRIYFERGKATIKFAADSLRHYGLEFNSKKNELSINSTDTDQHKDFFKGNYQLLKEELILHGTLNQEDDRIQVSLKKVR